MPSAIQPNLSSQLWLSLAASVALLVSAGVFYVFWPEIRRLDELEAQADALAQEEQRLRSQLTDVERKERWLREDPVYLEAVARDRLDLRRANETVFRIVPQESNPQPPPSP